MANVTVSSITVSGGNKILRGTSTAGGSVTVKNGSTNLGQDTASASGNWEVSFPSAGVATVTVSGAGRSVVVNVTTGVVTYADHTETLAIDDAVDDG